MSFPHAGLNTFQQRQPLDECDEAEDSGLGYAEWDGSPKRKFRLAGAAARAGVAGGWAEARLATVRAHGIPQDHLAYARERVRTRYRAEIEELAGLGFDRLCSYGATFSVFRLLLGIPALAILMLLPKRPVIGLWTSLRISECCPLLIASDKGAYAQADCEGVQFYTAFADGTFLVSSNYRTLTLEGPVMTKRWRAGTAGEVWAEHRAAVQSFETAGRQVDGRTSFQGFADLYQRNLASF